MEAPKNRPANVLALPRWTLIIHGVQMLLAISILGLDAYGIRWIAYNALIFSLVAALLTLGVCLYIVATSLFLHKLYNMYIVLGLHILMIIFWIVDMGLVANLARIWASPSCSYSYYYDSYSCGYGKRDLPHAFDKRETTGVTTYHGALAAGAFFGSVQFATWVLSTVFTVIYLNKHRASPNAGHAAPAYTGGSDQAVPLEQKYAQTSHPQPVYQQTPQPQYAQPLVQPQPQGQFVQQPVYNQQPSYTGQYPQDPVNREQTVSPVSQAAYSAPRPNASELISPQHTGTYAASPNASKLGAHHNPGYNPNVSELSNQK